MPVSRPGSAKTAASVCLYSVYRKQERSLFTAALEQTSNVPTAIIRPRPTASLWSPIPSIRSAIASLRRAARLRFDRCATAPETRPLLAVSRAHPSRVQRRQTGGGGSIPRPVVQGPLCFPGHALSYPPSRFGRATSDSVDRPQVALGFRHRPRTAPGPAGDRPSPLRAPAGDPTPITQVKVRTLAKSTTGFSLSKPVPGFKTGYRFSGSRLTP